jgi:hypothetical protein
MNDQTVFALSNDSIAAIVRIIQFGLLSGQDITDQFRAVRFIEEDGLMAPSPDWIDQFEKEMKEANEQLLARVEQSKFSQTNNN